MVRNENQETGEELERFFRPKKFVIEAQFEVRCSQCDANDDCYPLECDTV
jgi:hypothetical protein